MCHYTHRKPQLSHQQAYVPITHRKSGLSHQQAYVTIPTQAYVTIPTENQRKKCFATRDVSTLIDN